MQADPNAELDANAGDRARQDFLNSVEVRSVADRMPKSQGPEAHGMESVDTRKARGRRSPSESRKNVVLKISKAVLKKNCIDATEFQPVDELLMQHGRGACEAAAVREVLLRIAALACEKRIQCIALPNRIRYGGGSRAGNR